MSPQTKQIHRRIARVAFPAFALALIGLLTYAQMNDGDNDGISDGFESLFGLNMNADDSAGDPDQDGLSNRDESLLGTDPFNNDTDRDGWNDAADADPVSRAVFPWGEPRFTFDDQILYTWPPWAIGAQADGGQWIDEAPWGWMPEDGGSRLLMRLDRTQLSNDLWLAVAAPGAVAGDYLVSLCDTNLAALAAPIALAPSTTPWLTNRLPLAAYPAAAVVALFSTQGVAHVTLSMLYADANGDGLDDLQAAQLAAAAAATNTPSTNMPATVTVSGVVSYSGTQPGFVHVVAVTNASSWTSPWNTTLVNPGAFALGAIPVSATYWIRAYVDANENNSNDCWEARGVGLPSPLYLVCATNVTVTLTDPDSNADGLSDWGAMQVGLNPALSNACARFPFIELFETNTVNLGDIHGQHGWVASVTNTAWVQSNRVYAGQQALMLDAPASTATVHQVFAGDAAPVVWTDFRMIAQLGCPGGTNTTDGACGFFFDESGRLVVLDGLQPAGRKWVTLTNHPPVSAGEWMRISVCLNFAEQRWLMVLNGSKVAENLGFGIPCDQLHILSMKGERGVVDNLSVSTNQPANLSLDGDTLLDSWELQYFGNLAQTESGDPDADGLTNLQEYQLGTDPTNPDTDADTLPDGWEVARALNPLSAADAALDADNDGLSNLAEYEAGTDPRNPASHCWAISGRVDYEGSQTGAICVVVCSSPTGWSSIAQTMIATTGSYAVADVRPNSNYWVKAWRDSDGNGTNDSWEAWGAYTNHSITLFTNAVGVNFELADPDSDGDGIPDWWERSHSLNPSDPADAASDPDGDGLSNLAEYRYGTNPHQADTDGDGNGDGSEIQGGSNPTVSNTFARLPFLERFETNTAHTGNVNGQNGWMTTDSNTILVQTGLVWEGEQALAIQSSEETAGVRQLFSVTNAPVVWVDSHVVAWAAQAPTNLTASSATLFFNAQGYPMAYDGLIAGTNKWMALTNQPPLAMTGEWVRLTVKLDYGDQRWLVCVNGVLVGNGLGFATPVSHFNMIALEGQRGGLDALSVSTNQPPGLSLDGDALPDSWELQYFGNLDQTDSDDPDADGLTNLGEYLNGTDPTNPDTDADTLPDGWEVARALNPLSAADAVLDADNDGLSNLSEYANNTNPFLADTDGDTLSDGYEVNTLHTSPILADSDGDDYSDAVELARSTDPSDPASFPASEWQNHLKLILRNGALASTLTDVPVLVRLTPERIDYALCASDGRDLYFTDASGLPLAFELEQWDPAGESICWVRLPSISPTNSALHFWLHVGNPAALSASTPAAVWNANYAGVWHLTESDDLLADSTLGASAAANVGAVCASGILGNARNFRGSDYIDVPPAALAAISNAVTVSLWTYGADSLPANTICFYGSSAVGRELNAHITWSDANVYWDAFGNYDRISKAATAPLYKGTWNHWAFTKNATTGVMAIYCNGELWHSGTGKTLVGNPINAFRFGMITGGGYGYQGRMDELRVETVARSAEWNRFQYKSMRDQVLIYGDQVVSIVHAAHGSEVGPTPALFTVSRLGLNTNLPLSVVLAAPAGSATEGVDYTSLPRVVTIPAGFRSTTLSVPVIDDYWVEPTETVTVSVATGDYRVSTSNVTASASIADNDTFGDSSGMSDAFQLAFFGQLGVSPSADPDADGLSNLGEYLNGTDPTNPDTDADGMPDGWEVAHVLNPLSAADAPLDFDNDGLSNLREYQLGTNPRSVDTDADGMPDTWEVDHALNPIVNDAALDPDADGLSNLKEFQNSTDPHNPDTDGDGLLDGYEVNTSHTSPLKVDTDADGMPDKWELDHALNPLVNDAALDPDNDQLLNLDEFLQGTHPQMADTDGDGVSDQVEIMAQANPLTKDFTGGVTTLLTLHGSHALGWSGIWTCDGAAIYARTRSGCLDYDLVVPNAGTFAVAVNLTQQNNLTAQSAFDLSLFIDGIFSGRQVVKAPFGTSATATYFLPELAAGTHALRIQWHNQEPNTFLQINSIALQTYGGLDVNTNGIPDWLDHRRFELFDAITPATNSLVSPIFLEGTSFYQDLLAIAASFAPAGQTQQVVAVEHGVANDWYANVHLSPSNDTALVIADWATGVTITNTVAWESLNLIDHAFSNGLAIRAGSSLRLAAWPVDATNGTVTLTLWDAATNSVTNLIATVGSPVPYAFDQAGLFTVSGVYSNANGTTNGITNGTTNGTLSVRVVSGVFNGREAACVTGQPRTWECPGLTTDAVIVADSPLDVTATILANGGMRFSLMNPTDKPLYMVARLGEDGPILDSATISAVYGDHGSYFRVVETFSDGSRMVEVRLQLGSVPADLRVQLHVFVGGVTFLDGTLDKTLTAADFDAVGVCSYRLLQSAASFTSVCHTTQIYQDAVYIGGTR